ncbi:hypothetical protein O6H91_Y212100 [Diphasiastrum complanatum]|nr:hypothetical protein O6H91_Y212100 [Diphasiastrum complanatum]
MKIDGFGSGSCSSISCISSSSSADFISLPALFAYVFLLVFTLLLRMLTFQALFAFVFVLLFLSLLLLICLFLMMSESHVSLDLECLPCHGYGSGAKRHHFLLL